MNQGNLSVSKTWNVLWDRIILNLYSRGLYFARVLLALSTEFSRIKGNESK